MQELLAALGQLDEPTAVAVGTMAGAAIVAAFTAIRARKAPTPPPAAEHSGVLGHTFVEALRRIEQKAERTEALLPKINDDVAMIGVTVNERLHRIELNVTVIRTILEQRKG